MILIHLAEETYVLVNRDRSYVNKQGLGSQSKQFLTICAALGLSASET